MPTFKQTAASLRYLKARLKILKRPRVWATASGLILSVFLVGKYLADPQQYTGSNDLEATTTPPNQNPLGNLPPQNMPASNGELFETLPDLSAASLQPRSEAQSPRSDPSKPPLLQEFLLGRSSVTAQSAAAQKEQPKGSSQAPVFSSFAGSRGDRPSATQLPNFSPVGAVTALAGSPFSSATSQSSSSSSNDSTAINPLQAALDRYSSIGSQAQISPVPSPTQVSAELSSSDSTLPVAENPLRQNSWNRQEALPQGLPSPQFTPQISPLPGTTGYTLPAPLRTSVPSVSPFTSNLNLQPVPGQIALPSTPAMPRQFYDNDEQPSYSPGQLAYPRAQIAPSSPMPTPFSLPRAVPGRSIGGGQINTFSNP